MRTRKTFLGNISFLVMAAFLLSFSLPKIAYAMDDGAVEPVPQEVTAQLPAEEPAVVADSTTPTDAPAPEAVVVESPLVTETSATEVVVPTEVVDTPADEPVMPADEVDTPTDEPVVPTDVAVTPTDEPSAPAAAVDVPFVPAVEEPLTVPELMSQLPEDTSLVVLDQNGDSQALASQEAADIVASGDPMWCPKDITPGGEGCSPSFGSFQDLLNWMKPGGGIGTAGDGRIWIAADYNSSINDAAATGFELDGIDYTVKNSEGIEIFGQSLKNFALTIQGGWSGTLGNSTITESSQSTFSGDFLHIFNWDAAIAINNIIVKDIEGNTTPDDESFADYYGNALLVSTEGNVSLDDVTSQNNAGFYQSSPSSGNYYVGSGIEVNANGTITLNDVNASNNGNLGADMDNCYQTGGGCNFYKDVTFTGTNTFSSNGSAGLGVQTGGNIAINNTTASSNGAWGASLSNDFEDDGTKSVTMTGTNTFSSNAYTGLEIWSYGAITLNNITANLNKEYGVNIATDWFGSGKVTLNNITASFNGGSYYYAGIGLNIETLGDIDLYNITANENYSYGAYLDNSGEGDGTGSVEVTGAKQFNENWDTGICVYSDQGVTLENVVANENDYMGMFIVAGGDITTYNLTANANDSWGAVLSAGNDPTLPGDEEDYVPANPDGGSITMTGTNTFGYIDHTVSGDEYYGNHDGGLYAEAWRNITVANITAESNHDEGACLYAGYNSQGLEATGDEDYYYYNYAEQVFLDINGTNSFTYNGDIGLDAWTVWGDINAENVTANENDYYGAWFGTEDGGDIDLYNITANDNSDFGITVEFADDVTISDSQVDGNADYGIYVEDANYVTITDSTATNTYYDNEYGVGIGIYDSGEVELSGVHVSDSDWDNIQVEYSGDVTISDTVTHDSYCDGIYLYDNENVSLSGITSYGNGWGDGCTGTYIEDTYGDISISDSSFTHNDSEGLYVEYADGSVTIDSVDFSDNGRYDGDESGEAYGLYLYEVGDVDLISITANHNTGNGAFLFSGSGSVEVSDSDFNENGNDGLAIGTDSESLDTLPSIFLSRITANENDGNGFYYSSKFPPADIVIENSTLNDNELNGINIANEGGSTTLRCVTTLRNNIDMGDGENYIMPAAVEVLCGEGAAGAVIEDGDGGKGYMQGVGDGNPVSFNCNDYSGLQLTLPLGDFVKIPCASGGSAGSYSGSVLSLVESSLPAAPAGTFLSAFNVTLGAGQSTGSYLVSFKLAEGLESTEGYSILFWDGAKWVEVSGSQVGGYFQSWVDQPGIYVLVKN